MWTAGLATEASGPDKGYCMPTTISSAKAGVDSATNNPTNARRMVRIVQSPLFLIVTGRSTVPFYVYNCFMAIRAPSAIALNFSQITVG
jgi:hypothetical protein